MDMLHKPHLFFCSPILISCTVCVCVWV